MPTSDNATNYHITRFFERQKGKKLNILDCGVGSGKIGQLLSKIKDKKIHLDGVEIFDPYINNDEMKKEISSDLSFYKKIYIENMVSFLKDLEIKSYDYVIFGDSLEHLYSDVAEYTLEKAIRVSKKGVLVCVPIVKLVQGEVYGNISETHYHYWTKDNYEHLGGSDLGGSEVVRCFFYKPDLESYAYKPRSEKEQQTLGGTFTKHGTAHN